MKLNIRINSITLLNYSISDSKESKAQFIQSVHTSVKNSYPLFLTHIKIIDEAFESNQLATCSSTTVFEIQTDVNNLFTKTTDNINIPLLAELTSVATAHNRAFFMQKSTGSFFEGKITTYKNSTELVPIVKGQINLIHWLP